jgi:hypothetical protein
MPDLMGMKDILVLNDEAHHCYREKPGTDGDDELGRVHTKSSYFGKMAIDGNQS